MTKRTTDIEWTSNGFMVSLYPVTDAGKEAWGQIADAFDGDAKFPAHMWPSIRLQLKEAGYNIRKARPVSDKQLAEMSNDLLLD